MTKLFFKIIVLLIFVWLANNALFFFLKLPLLWGVDYKKQSFYENHSENFNTVFLGSSLTAHQIDNGLFDSLNSEKLLSTHSFNYGLDGATPVEIFSLFNAVMQRKPVALKNILVELDFIDNFDMGQLHSLRRKSFYGFGQYQYTLPLTLLSNYDWLYKAELVQFDMVHLVESEFKIGMLQDAYQFIQKQKLRKDTTTITGFSPLIVKDDENETALLNQTRINSRLKFLLEKKPELWRNTKVARQLFANNNFLHHLKINTTYKKMVTTMLQIAEAKKINLVFILPPRLSPGHYKDLLPVYFSLPAQNRIELADANEYPDFYKLEYSFDLWHVTEPCSRIYTKALQQKFFALNIAP